MTDRDRERMERLLLDIRSQATRKRRASALKRYLETDLEIIEEKVSEALKLMQKGRTS